MIKWAGKVLEVLFDWLSAILDPESKIHVLTLSEYNSDGLHVFQWKIPEGHTPYSTLLEIADYEVDKCLSVEDFLEKLKSVPSLNGGQEYSLCFDKGKKRILVRVY